MLMRTVVGCWMVSLSFSSVGSATVLRVTNLDELRSRSDVIVECVVRDVKSTQDPETRAISSTAYVTVLERFKGQCGSVLDFGLQGGTVGNIRKVVVGEPQVEVGDRLILLLEGAPLQIVGFSQGLFRIVDFANVDSSNSCELSACRPDLDHVLTVGSPSEDGLTYCDEASRCFAYVDLVRTLKGNATEEQ